MLVLCGSTYQSRLWCIWELFTLLAFMPMEDALEHLHLVPLLSHTQSADETDAVAQQLLRFDVQDAHCYDPNEEARLRQVIAALGNEAFNQRIRTLGRAFMEEITGASIIPGCGVGEANDYSQILCSPDSAHEGFIDGL